MHHMDLRTVEYQHQIDPTVGQTLLNKRIGRVKDAFR